MHHHTQAYKLTILNFDWFGSEYILSLFLSGVDSIQYA